MAGVGLGIGGLSSALGLTSRYKNNYVDRASLNRRVQYIDDSEFIYTSLECLGNMKIIKVKGLVSVIGGKKLESISAAGLDLKDSNVSGDIFAGTRQLRIIKSTVMGTVTFKGSKAVIKGSKVSKLLLKLSPNEEQELFIKKRTLVLVNSSVDELIIEEIGEKVDFRFTNSFVKSSQNKVSYWQSPSYWKTIFVSGDDFLKRINYFFIKNI